MKKLESNLPNMALVLTIFSVVVGALLAYVNNVTAGPIKEIQSKQLADGIKSVMGGQNLTVSKIDTVSKQYEGKNYVFVIYKAVDMSNQPIGAAVESTTGGFGGDLKVLVGFDKQDKISGYTILQTSETPGLGIKASSWFQKGQKGDIIGKSRAQPLSVSKDGGEVNAITASTITSRAFLKAVNQAYQAYKNK